MKATDWNRISSKLAGIYAYRNKINNDFFVGLSTKLRNCLKYNIVNSRSKYDPNNVLHKVWRKHGLGNFELIILESFIPEMSDKELMNHLYTLRDKYIEELNAQLI